MISRYDSQPHFPIPIPSLWILSRRVSHQVPGHGKVFDSNRSIHVLFNSYSQIFETIVTVFHEGTFVPEIKTHRIKKKNFFSKSESLK